ncbi:MAG: hypothetical protein ACYTXY_15470 [Nostoc sp.]
MFKRVPIFSFAIATSLPFLLVQAQTFNQTCETLLNNERSYVKWYPVKPLSETVDPIGVFKPSFSALFIQ